MALAIATRFASLEGLNVLDIGSHHLHFIAVLRELGANASGIDVEAFSTDQETRKLAEKLNIVNQTVNNLETDLESFLTGRTYDLIVFSEILEHITFNPRKMWKAMFRSIPEGHILVTTPNSMALHKMPGYLQRLLLLKGYGIKVEEILSTMTYGHHWKEYSVPELRHYFQLLDSSIPIEIRSVSGTDTYEGPPFEALIRHRLIGLTNRLPMLRFQIFCWIGPSDHRGHEPERQG